MSQSDDHAREETGTGSEPDRDSAARTAGREVPVPVSSSSRYRPLVQLVLARAREFLREPDAVFWVYVFPLFLVVALGIAFRNRPVEAFRVVVEEGDSATEIVAALNAEPRFKAEVCAGEECRTRLRMGRADLLLVPCGREGDSPAFRGESDVVSQTGHLRREERDSPPERLPSAEPTHFEYHFDPTRPESLLARNATDDFLQRRAGRKDLVAGNDCELTEPGGRYIDFLIPGLVGMGLMGGGLWGVGFAVVDMRIRKLLKRYLATPMRRGDFLVGLILSRLIFTVPEVALVVVFAHVFFGVACAGSYLLVALLVLVGSLQFAGLGLLVASRAQTMETVMGLMNAVMLPMWIGSGIFFSTERFPAVMQPLLYYALPLTPAIHALRAVMLEGAGLLSIAPDLAMCVLWGVAGFALALRWFRWS
jgi:ABC-type multidrug transport system permease subunit